MRFLVKKSQKDKKSGLYLSYFYTVYTYQKPWKLDTLLIPYWGPLCMGIFNRKPHTKYMGPDPHTKSMTHTNCVKCHTKCMGVTQNVWAPYLTMRHVLLESFVWEEANRVPFLIRGVSYDRDLSVQYCTAVLYS